MIMKVRLESIKKRFPNAIKIKTRYNLSFKYLKFLSKRTLLANKERYKITFTF